jgi:hypothetical protein
MSGALNELGIASPWLNVPGFLGGLPPARMDLDLEMGAFLPMSISMQPRSPVENRCLVRYPGGVLLHTGMPNPGLRESIKQYAARWARLDLPVWLSLLPNNADEAEEMSEVVDELENVTTFQLELPRRSSKEECRSILTAAAGEKSFFVEIPLDLVNRDTLGMVQNSPAFGVVLSAPRGRLLNDGKWVNGRLYGPALYPQVISQLHSLRRLGKAVVIGCGVSSIEQGEQLIGLGVDGVQVDLPLWN